MRSPVGLKVCLWIVLAAPVALAQPADSAYPAAREGSGGNYMFNYYMPPAPSSTPWAPAWSPDGKSIAVGLNGSIWRIEVSTGVATELTYNGRYHSSPAWSPDGKWIVYTAEDDGKDIQLEALELATGVTHKLTNDQHIYLDPVFSPDGNRLAYTSTYPDGRFNLFMRAIHNGEWAGDEVRLTPDNRFPRARLYFSAWDIHIQPAWTPDGKEIVFVSNRDVPLGSGDLYRMPVIANGAAQAKLILREQSLYRTQPHVSVDGKRVLYSSTSGSSDQYHQLYVVPLVGGAPYKLTFQPHDHFQPRWSPDGEWIAYISNEGGLPQLCLLETYGGTLKKIAISKRIWKRPTGLVHVKVLDASGKSMAARIQYLSADGKFYAPPDAYARIGGASSRHLFHTTGEFTAEVPAGNLHMVVVKGFEYQPVEMDVAVQPGRTTDSVVRLKRIANLPGAGWYSGSTHVHMNYGGNLHNTLENLMMMSEAEDQQLVNELIANKDNRILDWQYFVPGGGEHPVSRGKPGVKVLVGEEYRPPFWGHVFLLGLKDHLLSPFTTGYEGTGIESLYPSNTDIFRKASAQGALTGYVHPYAGERDPLETATLGEAKGFPIDAALGTVQCLEWSEAGHATYTVWHNILNLDLPIVATGGEDSISNLHRTRLVGSARTYVYTCKNFSVDSWLAGVRAGHTFYSTGPLLELHINGRIPGDVIKLPAAGSKLAISGSVTSFAPLSKVVIYNNGKVLQELPKSGPFQIAVDATRSGWYELYAEGPADPRLDTAFPQAHTTPIRVYVGDEKIHNAESAAYFIRWMDKLKPMVSEWPGWRSEAEKNHVLEQFEQARSVYEKLRGL